MDGETWLLLCPFHLPTSLVPTLVFQRWLKNICMILLSTLWFSCLNKLFFRWPLDSREILTLSVSSWCFFHLPPAIYHLNYYPVKNRNSEVHLTAGSWKHGAINTHSSASLVITYSVRIRSVPLEAVLSLQYHHVEVGTLASGSQRER